MSAASNQPSHLVYHVQERDGDDQNNWTKIGAMWPHQDGKGFNMQLQYLPVGGSGKLTIRVNEPRQASKAA